VTAGAFGRAVGVHLQTLLGDALDGIDDAVEGCPRADVHVLAAWRPMPALCEQFDRLSHERRRPFVPLTVDGAVLRLGPVVVPGRGPCWSCWSRRAKQHAAPAIGRGRDVAAQDSAGIEPSTEPYALLGAARIVQTIEALQQRASIAGHVWQLDMTTREITTTTAVGVHDCPLCGLHRRHETRTVSDMRRHLAHLWQL